MRPSILSRRPRSLRERGKVYLARRHRRRGKERPASAMAAPKAVLLNRRYLRWQDRVAPVDEHTPAYGSTIAPMKTKAPVPLSSMTKKNGRSTCMVKASSTGMAEVRPIWTDVAAAASVPASFTST